MNQLTKEFCEKEARKYSTIKDFRKNSQSIYLKALQKNWLCEYTWLIKLGGKQPKKWTKLATEQEAKKYKTLKDFSNLSAGAYKAARKNKWLKDYVWLEKKVYNPNEKLWYVYVYEILNKYVYVGLTVDPIRRNYEHTTKKNRDRLAKFCYENKINIKESNFIIKAENLTAVEAQNLEDKLKSYYLESKNWIVINTGKTGIGTGSLGSGIQKWDKETCKKAAENCKTRADFKSKFPRAYRVSIKNKWINEYTWLIEKPLIKRVIQYDLNGNFIREYPIDNPENYKKSHINCVASGKSKRHKTAYGFRWKYKDDVLDSEGNIIKKLDL